MSRGGTGDAGVVARPTRLRLLVRGRGNNVGLERGDQTGLLAIRDIWVWADSLEGPVGGGLSHVFRHHLFASHRNRSLFALQVLVRGSIAAPASARLQRGFIGDGVYPSSIQRVLASSIRPSCRPLWERQRQNTIRLGLDRPVAGRNRRVRVPFELIHPPHLLSDAWKQPHCHRPRHVTLDRYSSGSHNAGQGRGREPSGRWGSVITNSIDRHGAQHGSARGSPGSLTSTLAHTTPHSNQRL